jgi:hypothetical protein
MLLEKDLFSMGKGGKEKLVQGFNRSNGLF